MGDFDYFSSSMAKTNSAGAALMENSEFAKVEQDAKAQVVRWQWYDGPAMDPRAFHAQRERREPGEPLAKEPAQKIGAWHWGFDAQDRPRVGYEHLFKEISSTLVYQFDDAGAARAIEFSNRGSAPQVWAITEILGPYDRPTGTTRHERDAKILENYSYQGERIVAIEMIRQCPPGEEVFRRKWTVQHGEDGQVTVQRESSAARETIEPVAAKELEAFVEKVEERIAKVMMDAAKKAKVGKQRPIYCLILAYDASTPFSLPPMPALGLEQQRKKWKQEHGRRAKDYVWNPAEFELYETDELKISDPQLEKDCRRLCHTWKGSMAKVRALLNRVAKSLAQGKWPASVDRTDDFVVFAVELEGGDRARNMKETVNSKVLATLKSDGWL